MKAPTVRRGYTSLNIVKSEGAPKFGAFVEHPRGSLCPAEDVEALEGAMREALDTIDEGKRQWDQVAALLGAHGDDVDAVIERATVMRNALLSIRHLVENDPNGYASRFRAVGEIVDVALEGGRL